MTKKYKIRLAQNASDLVAAQKLRYQIFVTELGAKVSAEDHTLGQERDAYDPICDHLLLIDIETDDVVGVYRLLRREALPLDKTFYSANEYDLSALLNSGKNLLEMGRSCIAVEHRGGEALQLIWMALGRYIVEHAIDIMFGTASFKGTNVQALAQPLSCLSYFFTSEEHLCPQVLPEHGQKMDILPKDQVNRAHAMSKMPTLIKGYLRLGGKVGRGAYVDHAFNTTDVLIVTQTKQVADKYLKMYGVYQDGTFDGVVG